MKDFVTKDSGKRQEFETGSKRDTREGKGRFDLIPIGPLRRLAGLYERGAKKYGDHNWRKGQPLMRYLDSLMRHTCDLIEGEPLEDHAAAIAWNAFGFMWTLSEIEAGRLPRDLDDRPAPAPRHDPNIAREVAAAEQRERVRLAEGTLDRWIAEEIPARRATCATDPLDRVFTRGAR